MCGNCSNSVVTRSHDKSPPPAVSSSSRPPVSTGCRPFHIWLRVAAVVTTFTLLRSRKPGQGEGVSVVATEQRGSRLDELRTQVTSRGLVHVARWERRGIRGRLRLVGGKSFHRPRNSFAWVVLEPGPLCEIHQLAFAPPLALTPVSICDYLGFLRGTHRSTRNTSSPTAIARKSSV